MMTLGDRVKRYEQPFRNYAVHRMPLIIRVDGRAFHTFTRRMDKPFDKPLMRSMVLAALNVARYNDFPHDTLIPIQNKLNSCGTEGVLARARTFVEWRVFTLTSEQFNNIADDPISDMIVLDKYWVIYQNQAEIASENIVRSPLLPKETAINFLNKNEDDYWHIGYEGQSARIKHVDGLLYISHLLMQPRMSISCDKLYDAVSGGKSRNGNIMSVTAAIEEGLSIGSGRGQAVTDNEAKQDYLKRYHRLQNDLAATKDTPEGELERKEIEKEMDQLVLILRSKQKTFTDHNKNIQINIHKRLNKAYVAFEKKGLKKLAEHLRANIRPGGTYDLIYAGSIEWDITL